MLMWEEFSIPCRSSQCSAGGGRSLQTLPAAQQKKEGCAVEVKPEADFSSSSTAGNDRQVLVAEGICLASLYRVTV